MDSRWIRLPALLGAAISLLTACSVKEDRSPCPCLLTVDLSETLNESVTPVSLWDKGLKLSVSDAGKHVFYSASYDYDSVRPEYCISVNRGDVIVAGILGVDKGLVSGTEYHVSENCQADRLFVSSSMVECEGEESYCALKMYKQYSEIRISGLDSLDYRMEVVAGCAGLDLQTRRALPGQFRYELSCDDDGLCCFRMPRQSDDELQIIMYDASGHMSKSIPLGMYMTDMGYDWDAESLSDVTVNVDKVTVAVTISINGWSGSIKFPFTI